MAENITTWSVKISEEQREKLSNMLQESGLQGKEFISNLINTYELSQIKTQRPEIAPDLQELEQITTRINSIYINIAERVNTILIDKDNSHKGTLEKKETIINQRDEKILKLEAKQKELEETIRQLEKKIELINKEHTEAETNYDKQINQLTEINLSNKALVEEYKQKNDTLTGLLSEYKIYKEKAQALITELEAEKDHRKELQEKNKTLEDDLSRTNAVMIKTADDHKEQIASIKEQCLFEKDKALLEQEKTFQKEKQVQMDEYNMKIKELLQELNKKRKDVAREESSKR